MTAFQKEIIFAIQIFYNLTDCFFLYLKKKPLSHWQSVFHEDKTMGYQFDLFTDSAMNLYGESLKIVGEIVQNDKSELQGI